MLSERGKFCTALQDSFFFLFFENNSNNFYRQTRTRDMGGQATTHEFTRAVLDKMEASL